MKGRIGGTAAVESPMKGVVAPTPTPPQLRGSNVIAAVKRRKRGGAVPDSGGKVEGKMAMARLDKPKRARGGSVDDNIARQTKKADGQVSDMMSKRASSPATSASSSDKAMKTISDAMKPKRAHGGKVGADKKPLTSANREKPARGHSTGGNLD